MGQSGTESQISAQKTSLQLPLALLHGTDDPNWTSVGIEVVTARHWKDKNSFCNRNFSVLGLLIS